MKHQNVSSTIIEGLLAIGVDTFYCLPGVQNDDFFNVLYDYTDRIEVITTRHEQGAAYMALGAAMATGKPQMYCVVPGEGMLNASTALATAFGLAQPVFALIGQIPTPFIGKMWGNLHELPDQLAILKQLTKHASSIQTGGDTAFKQIEEAMNALVSNMPRPVSLEVPMNIWSKPVEATPLSIKPTSPPLDDEAIDAAAKLLASSKKPLIFLGGGAQHAGEPIREMVDLIQAPFTSNRTGHGVVDERHELAAIWPMAHKLWQDADVVLAIGTRLQSPQMGWGIDSKLKIIHINIDADEIGRQNPVAVGIHGDSLQAMTALVERTRQYVGERESRAAEVAGIRAEIADRMAYLEPQLSYLKVIRDVLPEDGIFVEDLTQVGFVSRLAYPVYQPRTFISSGYPGTLGWGFATALGAQNAMRDRKVVSVSGDGGFMYTASELATAVQYNIPITQIVFADNAYGNVKRIQQEKFDGRTIASDLHNPDFVKLAEAYGAVGLRATNPEELRSALQQGLDTDAPVIIEVPVGEMPSPWQFILLPMIRGDGESMEF